MIIRENGTIEGEGWWIYTLSALIRGNAQDIVRGRNECPYLLPDPEHEYKLNLKVGLSGLISELRKLARTGLTSYRSLEEGVHEHALTHRLLGPISFHWSTEGSLVLKAEGRPIFTAQPVTRKSATVRWHFNDSLRATVEHILACPTGKLVRPEELVDGSIANYRPEQGAGWLDLINDLRVGNAQKIIASRNTNPFLLPEETHASRLPRLAGYQGFVEMFEHIAGSRHATRAILDKGVQEYACEHRQIGRLCWRNWINPGPFFELDVDGQPLLSSVQQDSGSWNVLWQTDHELAHQVQELLTCGSGRQYYSEWQGV